MVKHHLLCAIVVAALACAGIAASQQAPSISHGAQHTQEEANKALVREFMRPTITLEERMALLHPDYIQHNPLFVRVDELNHVRGREGFRVGMIAIFGGEFPPPPVGTPEPKPYVMMAQGDLVTTTWSRYLPDPQNPGKFYESFDFDTFRIKDGKLYEHWDSIKLPEVIPDYLKAPVGSLRPAGLH